MSANVAFLTRLARIASETSCAEARAAHAAALVQAYAAMLYESLGITSSRRLTARAKEVAEASFDALRRALLKGEIDAPPALAGVFAAARERTEMARRALALRVTIEDAGEPDHINRFDDRQWLLALHAGLRDRDALTRSQDAIEKSRELLGK
jgi:hypothetical protein